MASPISALTVTRYGPEIGPAAATNENVAPP
jgi:hypothetical protein